MLHSLTLCDTACEMNVPEMWKQRIDTAQNDGMGALVSSTLERWFTEPFRTREASKMGDIGTMIQNTPVMGFVGCCTAIAAMNHADLLPQISTGTLVLVGADDPATTVDHSKVIHDAVDGSDLVILDEAAHLSNIEQPDAFNAALLAHLDKH